MKIMYSYEQHAVVECSGTLEVPDEVVAKGAEAVHAFIRENESPSTEIIDWKDEVDGTMGYEKMVK